MHLAFVTSLVVDGRPTTGFEVANEAIVAGLRAIGNKVSVIGFCQPRQQENDDPDTLLLGTISVENAGASLSQKVRWMVAALARGLPVGGSKLCVATWAEVKAALDGLGKIDGIIINSVQMPSAFPQLLDYAPFCYVAHNVEHRSAARNAEYSGRKPERYFYARDARLLKPIEAKLCTTARHVFVLGEDDRAALGLANEKSQLLPMVFPATNNTAENQPADTDITHDVGLIGTWTWQPNFAGLRWFLDKVVPLLDPDMSISIAGNAPDVGKVEHGGVKFVGRVASARSFVAQSLVLALISRGGTGVQLKTIEAFQAGMPCIATSSSVRGLTEIPSNCRVEDDAMEFAAALNGLVGTVKTGKTGKLDGSAFAETQRRGLEEVLRQGLKVFKH